jgi:hypothetical protein
MDMLFLPVSLPLIELNLEIQGVLDRTSSWETMGKDFGVGEECF